MRIYTIYDDKSGLYSTPFFEHNDTTALRAFTTAVNNQDPQNQLRNSPGDFALMHIGDWDAERGSINGTKADLISTATKALKE